MEQSIYLPRIFSSKIDANSIFVMMLFIIYPLGALPFILLEIYNKKRYAFSLLAIFIGVFSLLSAPVWDLQRHNGWFFGFQDTSSSLFDILSERPDYIVWSMEYLFAKNGINFEIIRFILIYAEYEMIFWIFRDLVRRNEDIHNNNRMYIISFIMVFLSGAFFHSTNGLRYGIAEVMMAYGAYKLFVTNGYISGWIAVFLSAMCHIGTIIIIPFVVIAKFYKKYTLSRDTVAVLAIACFIFGIIALKSFVQGMYSDNEDSDIINMGNAYVQGQMLGGFFSLSYWYYIGGYGEITTYPLLIWFIISSEYRTTQYIQYKNCIVLIILLLFVTLTYNDLAMRWMTILVLCLIPYFLLHYHNNNKRYVFWIFILLLSLFISTGVKMNYFRATIMVGRNYMLLNSSLPTMLSQTYTAEEVADCEYRSQVILGNQRSRGDIDDY